MRSRNQGGMLIRPPSRLLITASATAALLAGIAWGGVALGGEPRFRASAGAGHALNLPQRDEFGWGAFGALQGEWLLGSKLSLFAGAETLTLSNGQSVPTGIAPHGSGSATWALAGLRLYPLVRAGGAGPGLWLSADGGLVRTGSLNRAGLGADLGYDIWLSNKFALGPVVSFRQIIQPDDTLRPADARLGMIGISGVWAPMRSTTVIDPDRDHDGIPNERDACPDDPEDFDGFQDTDGCPDLDNDNDGIVDKFDKCPNDPEDYDHFQDTDGCPDLDNDKDGIPDVRDKCPDDPEDFDGFEDEDGCPDVDNDQDRIPDVVDKCPNEPETYNGYADDDGCPDEQQVRVVGTKIVLDDRIYFEWNRAEIRKESYALVQHIAQLLTSHPEYLQVSIEGHTDEMGSVQYNQKLSEARAAAVRDLLIKFGIDGDRLVSVGFGELRPLVKGHTEAANAANRRVEFDITKRKVTGAGDNTPAPAPSDGGPQP